MAIYKVEAQGDVVYVKGKTIDEAKRKLKDSFGEIPDSLLTWTQIRKLPKGEVFIAE